MKTTMLSDRAVVAVDGKDAEALLNRLLTKSVVGMALGDARYAALLSPQGKLLHDVLVCRRDNAFWLDCRADHATDLAKKLVTFKLRAKANIERRADLTIAAAWGGALMAAPGATFRDPRHNALGYRIVAAPELLHSYGHDEGSYDAHRIACGVPFGGIDWVYGDTFVHDANLDLLGGVDFDKGCYVGQEVVSRVHHRNSARKRIVSLEFFGATPPVGTPLSAGDARLGEVTSVSGAIGLASARIDKLAEAKAHKAPVTAGDVLLSITLPARSIVVSPPYTDEDDLM